MIAQPKISQISRPVWLLLVAVATAAAALSGRSASQDVRLPPLVSVKGNPRIPGKFVWADLVTDDAKTARAFYTRMFGWTFRDFGGYFVGENDEHPLCGIVQQPRPKDRPAQPRWLPYMSVSSVDRAQRAVLKGGGRVAAPPGKILDRGEQALFADAEGAVFGVIKSSSGDPKDFLAEPGDWIWIQFLSRDAKKASEFYRVVGEYEARENTASARLSDYVLVSDGYARATIRTIPKANTHVQPAWLPFVRVKSVSESVALAKQLGGKVLIEPKPELFNGKVAVIADPTGAAIGILEWAQDMTKGGS
jgi:predicted enzyme related to lactoylglutathione lyase